MFEGKSLYDILEMGGWVLWVLIGISITSFTVICYKCFEFWKKGKILRTVFLQKLFEIIRVKGLVEAIKYCDSVDTPLGEVAKVGINAFMSGLELEECMDREIRILIVELEKYITILGTIGNIAVYIGLFGTVLGIINAFASMSSSGGGGISVIIGSISEALLATATGLFVAIPASVAYNFIIKRIDKFVVDMEYCASALEESFNLNKGQK